MTVFLWVSSGEEDIIFPADTRTDHSIHGFSCSRNAISQALPSVTAGFFSLRYQEVCFQERLGATG